MDDRSDESAAKARVGETIGGHLRLDELVGIGGMGAVYRATNVKVDRELALKVLLPRFANNKEVNERFNAEGRIANKIPHRSVVKILDSGVTDDGCPYLVMEFLRGMSLQAKWEKQGLRMDPRAALDIAVKLLDVLAKAHEVGVVHRDIKPDNIFLTDEGELKVLDFGIARLQQVAETAAGTKGKTRIGTPMGTAGFMAPEQARGRWNEVDARTDLWAVGATLFALLTGETVDEQDGGGLMSVPPIQTRLPALDAQVAGLVDRALAYRREDRWPDAATMQKEAAAVLARLPQGPLLAEREPAVVHRLASASTEPAAAPFSTPTLPGAPVTAEGADVARTDPGAPFGASGAHVARTITPTDPGAPTEASGASIAQGTARPERASEARTTSGAPAEEALKSGGAPSGIGSPSMVQGELSKQPQARPRSRRAGYIAVLLLGTAAAISGFVCTRGNHDSNNVEMKPNLASTNSPLPPSTPSQAPGPSPSSDPVPPSTSSPTIPALYQGIACNKDGVPDPNIKSTDVVTSKSCGGQCVSLGVPATGCKVGTCESCNLPHATPGCPKPGKTQTCVVQSCETGFDNCDGLHENGCEIDISKVENCGKCGYSCPARDQAVATCEDRKCSFSCNAGYDSCDGNPANGCETDLNKDPVRCGSCKNRCDVPSNAVAACNEGKCGFTCKPDFHDGDGNAANGCEVDLRTNVEHCGAIRNRCSAPANMTPSCTNKVCGSSCNKGFKDCDGDLSNGCEDILSDENHCGSSCKPCVKPKGGSVSCESGQCRPRCDGDATYKASTNECVVPAPPPPPVTSSEPDAGAPPTPDAGAPPTPDAG